MYKIVLSESSKNDLNYILEIIFRFTFNQDSVDRLYNEIVSQIYSLQIFPNRYVEYKYWLRVLNIRWKYKVFYKVNENKQEVQIYRILFSANNYENIF